MESFSFELMQILALLALLVMPGAAVSLLPKLNTVTKIKLPVDNVGRIEFFSFLKGVAIVAVVMIHVTYFFDLADIMPLLQAQINNFLRFAVAIFFVASGVLLATPKYTVAWLKNFYLRRLGALLPAYLLVTVAVMAIEQLSWQEWLYGTATGTIEPPFYFMIVLLQMYVLYPVLYPLAAKRWFVWLMLALSVVSYALIPIRWWGDVVLATSFIFFFVWGIYLRQWFRFVPVPSIRWRYAAVAIVVYMALSVYFTDAYFYNGQFIYSIAFILLVHELYARGCLAGWVISVFVWLGHISLWIFLTHFTLMRLTLPALIENTYQIPMFILWILAAVYSLVLSVFLAYICHLIYKSTSNKLSNLLVK